MTRANRLFTLAKLNELSSSHVDLMQRALRRNDIDAAIVWCDEMAQSQVVLHDFFAESCTILWSWVGRNLGETTVETMFRYIFLHAAQRQFYAPACIDAPPHLSVLLLAKSWRAHSCFGEGEHPGKFTISEDAEKFTFQLRPCGSGLRLWRKGFYGHGAYGKRTEAARPWNYRRERFPYYCLHCPFLNEILPYESAYGALLWPVDPPATPKDICAWHIYKTPRRIPASYYDRLGLKPKVIGKNRFYQPGRKYFSKAQLAEMSRPMTTRLREQLEAGDVPAAWDLIRDVKGEFLVLHDLYVNMLVATLTFIADKAGEERLGEALRQQWKHCVKPQVDKHLETMTPEQKFTFLARRIFVADICNGAGRHPGRVFIKEADSEITFKLSPCGSGGRLLRAGCYHPRTLRNRLREGAEDRIIGLAAKFPYLSEAHLEKMFPRIIGLFTQRKPYEQGVTQQAYPWSFDRSEVPYFCCQCGQIADAYKYILSIKPPTGKRGTCTWTFQK